MQIRCSVTSEVRACCSNFSVFRERVISVEEERAEEGRGDKKEEKQPEDFYQPDSALVHAILLGGGGRAQNVALDVDFRENRECILVFRGETLLKLVHAIPLHWPPPRWNWLNGSKCITNSPMFLEKPTEKRRFYLTATDLLRPRLTRPPLPPLIPSEFPIWTISICFSERADSLSLYFLFFSFRLLISHSALVTIVFFTNGWPHHWFITTLSRLGLIRDSPDSRGIYVRIQNEETYELCEKEYLS